MLCKSLALRRMRMINYSKRQNIISSIGRLPSLIQYNIFNIDDLLSGKFNSLVNVIWESQDCIKDRYYMGIIDQAIKTTRSN